MRSTLFCSLQNTQISKKKKKNENSMCMQECANISMHVSSGGVCVCMFL